MNLLLRIQKLERIIKGKTVSKEEIRERIFREGSLCRALCNAYTRKEGGDAEKILEECYNAEISGLSNGLNMALNFCAKTLRGI